MASPTSPTDTQFRNGRRRTNTASSVAHSVHSASNSAISFTEDLVMHHDPPPGFFAATAQATSKAPTIGDIRRGSFGQDGWSPRSRRSSSGRRSRGSRDISGMDFEGHGMVESFAPLTEEPSRLSTEIGRAEYEAQHTIGGKARALEEEEAKSDTAIQLDEPTPRASAEHQRTDHDRIPGIAKHRRIHSSGYVPPPKVPWTTATAIALKGFWKWFTTPFGFFLTLYGLNVVAWGGMLFLLLCNAAPAMCWAPIPNKNNQKHVGDIAALSLPGPYYYNCNDLFSTRRIWLEIDCQIVNALFCVTGFGLAPWRFRDLYYLLRWRLASEKNGRESKIYGLRVLAGIHKGWFRLPGSQTVDTLSTQEYLGGLERRSTSSKDNDLEAFPSALSIMPENDPRIPLPISKRPDDPPTSIRAPPTKLWKLDFFVWTQVWNTFFQICLCGFMWGMNRYTRPSWSTGLFVALACIVAAVGGIVSFLEGKKVKKVEGVAPKEMQDLKELGEELAVVNTNRTGYQSVPLGEKVVR